MAAKPRANTLKWLKALHKKEIKDWNFMTDSRKKREKNYNEAKNEFRSSASKDWSIQKKQQTKSRLDNQLASLDAQYYNKKKSIQEEQKKELNAFRKIKISSKINWLKTKVKSVFKRKK